MALFQSTTKQSYVCKSNRQILARVLFAETDRSRLPDLEDDLKLVSKTLQHKCYSLLTGDDRELFPDLPQKNVMSASGTVGDRSKGGKRIFKVGRKEVKLFTQMKALT